MRPVCKRCGSRTFSPALAHGLCKMCLRQWVAEYRGRMLRGLSGEKVKDKPDDLAPRGRPPRSR